jgi:hypothetical protein
MRGRVGKAEVSVLARENRTSAASAPGAGNLAKTVPYGEGRTQRKRACPLKLKRIERRERRGGRRDSGLGLQDSGFLIPNTHFPIPVFFTGHSHETENIRQP